MPDVFIGYLLLAVGTVLGVVTIEQVIRVVRRRVEKTGSSHGPAAPRASYRP